MTDSFQNRSSIQASNETAADGNPTTVDAKKTLQGYAVAIQKARSGLRESHSGPEPSSLKAIDREAAKIDPVLFSERCETLLQKLVETAERGPDAVTVMNFSWMMRRMAGLDQDDPWAAPDVSHALRITLASMDRHYDFTENPLAALTGPPSAPSTATPDDRPSATNQNQDQHH